MDGAELVEVSDGNWVYKAPDANRYFCVRCMDDEKMTVILNYRSSTMMDGRKTFWVTCPRCGNECEGVD